MTARCKLCSNETRNTLEGVDFYKKKIDLVGRRREGYISRNKFLRVNVFLFMEVKRKREPMLC